MSKRLIEATLKGETGFLAVRVVNGTYRYSVTLDEATATLFPTGGVTARHAARARRAGITVHLDE